MEKEIRAFIAVKIIPDKKLNNLCTALKSHFKDEQIKWVKDDVFHVTLKFLGEISTLQINEIETVLLQIANKTESFVITVKGLGYFKRNRLPQVLFAQISGDHRLKLIASEINDRLQCHGFEKETKPFKAHITLGRIKHLKNKSAFYSWIEEFRDIDLQRTGITELIFYKSMLTPKGPIYIPLSEFRLQQ